MSNINIAGYLQDKFGYLSLDGNNRNARVPCPFCGDQKKRMYIKVVGAPVVHCFHCGYAGKFIDFLMEYEGISSYKELFTEYLAKYKVDPKTPKEELVSIASTPVDWNNPFARQTETDGIVDKLNLPDDYTLINQGISVGYYIKQYIMNRGFSLDYAAIFNIGFSTHWYYKDMVIIPTLEDDQLAFYTLRYIGSDLSKSKVLRSPQASIPSAVFNLDKANQYDTVYIVEGWADALSIGSNAVSLNGKSMSKGQLARLIEADFKNYIVVLDSEAVLETLAVADSLSGYHDSVYCVFLDEGDPNDNYLTGRLQSLLQNKTLYTELGNRCEQKTNFGFARSR